MSAKVIFILCAVAQSVICQCISQAAIGATEYAAPYSWSGPGLAAPALSYEGLGVTGRGLARDGLYPAVASNVEFTPTSGGALAVTSGSTVPPTGISVVSENAYEGALTVAGELPFVGTSAVDGVVPSAGEGAINHACGNGVNAMESEIITFAPEVTIAPIAAAIPPVAATFPITSPLSPAGRISSNSGFGLANNFGFRGCGNRGLIY